MVLVGFFLEGMRIAMTGWPAGSTYAFLGYIVSKLFSDPVALAGAYGYVWYVHSILAGIFIAYIPFSRLSHMIVAPLVLAMSTIGEAEQSEVTKVS
jgi:nitrate reductase gamma subunit